MPAGPRVKGKQLTWENVQRGLSLRANRYALLTRLPRGGEGAEIGVWRGDFSAKLLRWTRPKRLHLIDPWEHVVDERYEEAMFGRHGQDELDACFQDVVDRFASDDRVVIHRDRSSAVAASFADDTLDWVYIDGDHTYSGVLNDLEAYYRITKAGGVLAGDDYGFAGWWDNGVTEAVNEFVARRSLRGFKIIGAQFLIRKG